MIDARIAARLGNALVVLALIALLTGCSPAPETAPAAPAESIGTGPVMTAPPELETAADLARADLALRLDVEPESITLIEARSVTWSNGAMGCPEPDMMYTQALVPGYRILLRAGTSLHAYHGARGGRPFFCPAERAGEPLPDRDDLR